jgi:hypothetical protein
LRLSLSCFRAKTWRAESSSSMVYFAKQQWRQGSAGGRVWFFEEVWMRVVDVNGSCWYERRSGLSPTSGARKMKGQPRCHSLTDEWAHHPLSPSRFLGWALTSGPIQVRVWRLPQPPPPTRAASSPCRHPPLPRPRPRCRPPPPPTLRRHPPPDLAVLPRARLRLHTLKEWICDDDEEE